MMYKRCAWGEQRGGMNARAGLKCDRACRTRWQGTGPEWTSPDHEVSEEISLTHSHSFAPPSPPPTLPHPSLPQPKHSSPPSLRPSVPLSLRHTLPPYTLIAHWPSLSKVGRGIFPSIERARPSSNRWGGISSPKGHGAKAGLGAVDTSGVGRVEWERWRRKTREDRLHLPESSDPTQAAGLY